MNIPPLRHSITTRLARAPEALIRPYYLRYSKSFIKHPTLTCVKQGNRLVYNYYYRLNKPYYPISLILISNYLLLTSLGSLVLYSLVKSVNPLSKCRVSASRR
jgi:hypothetical protein